MIVGLTGSIGMGKSTVAAMFTQMGVPVFDADAEVHRLQAPGSPLLSDIAARFPEVVVDNVLDRLALGRAVFGNDNARRDLEAIIYPALAARRQRWLRRHRAHDVIILDIPLLFEKGYARGRGPAFDCIIVVSAPAWVQRRRVMARPGMTGAKFRQILRLQMPDSEKRRRADLVINTGVHPHETRQYVRALTQQWRGLRHGQAIWGGGDLES